MRGTPMPHWNGVLDREGLAVEPNARGLPVAGMRRAKR
jgi:hypothetical protein